MKKSFTTLLGLTLVSSSIAGEATSPFSANFLSKGTPNPTSHAPIGVMGDHTHKKGEWMFSYRYMAMDMQQNYDGDSVVSDAAIAQAGGAYPTFAVAPTDMKMEMHMFGLMYAPSDKLTLMGMVNYVESSMNHITRMGGTFKTSSSGLGDSSITALYSFYEKGSVKAHWGLGLQLPTAKTDAADFIPPAGRVVRLPYPMQLGSGTFAALPSVTYNDYRDGWAWGAQAKGKIHLSDNSDDYKPGTSFEVSSWFAKQISSNTSLSFRLKGMTWGNYSGSDSNIPGLPVPTVRTDLRGGSRIDAAIGANFIESKTGLRFGLELSKTVYQKLDGPQLGNDWDLTAGIQYAW